MPTLSDRLKSLGVKVGVQDLPKPLHRNPTSISQVLPGIYQETPFGDVFVVETLYSPEYRHGQVGLYVSSSLQTIAEWAGEKNIAESPLHSLVFLDTETTGLSGGSGTYAFLIGVGRFIGDDFLLAQYFMGDPIQEPAQLSALEGFLAPCNTLVTFNGKAFDIPILNSRFISQGWRPTFSSYSHIDLLPLARRLWRERLASRTLGNLEFHILGAKRTEDDIPGWMIPQIYFDYLRSGDALPLKNVFYHNAMDVLGMAALLNHMAGLLEDPIQYAGIHIQDILAVGKLFEDIGSQEIAIKLYSYCLEQPIPPEALLEGFRRLSYLHKRRGEYLAAEELWRAAAGYQQIYAFIELSKLYEHRVRDIQEAARWASAALELVDRGNFSYLEREEWRGDLEHRLQRLIRKMK